MGESPGAEVLGNIGLSFLKKAEEEEEVLRNIGEVGGERKERQVADDDTPRTGRGPSI